ncbi:MAG: type II toxin-antitoxin system HicA family toxin [Thermodesulfobacteriota bacterium]
MSKIDKIIARLKSRPKDFTWDELTRVMFHFGYTQLEGGGSRVKFFHKDKMSVFNLHRPHKPKILRGYQIKEALSRLETDGFI